MGAPEKIDIEAEERLRLAVASRIAAGLVANPEALKMRAWERECAMSAVKVADQLIQAVRESAR